MTRVGESGSVSPCGEALTDGKLDAMDNLQATMSEDLDSDSLSTPTAVLHSVLPVPDTTTSAAPIAPLPAVIAPTAPTATLRPPTAQPVDEHPLSPDVVGDASPASSGGGVAAVRSYFEMKSASTSVLPTTGSTTSSITSPLSTPSPSVRTAPASIRSSSNALSPPPSAKVPLFPDRPEPPETPEPIEKATMSTSSASLASLTTPKPSRVGLVREDTVMPLSSVGILAKKRMSLSPRVDLGREQIGSGSPVPGSEETVVAGPSKRTTKRRETYRVSLSQPPHHLSPTQLASEIPVDQQVPLVRYLSQSLTSAETLLRQREAEIAALVELMTSGYGVGEGEVERCRVRARAEVALVSGAARGNSRDDWEAELELPDPVAETASAPTRTPERLLTIPPGTYSNPSSSTSALHRVSTSSTASQLDSELQEAMSESAFDAASLHSVSDTPAGSGSALSPPEDHYPAVGVQATPTPASKRSTSLSARLWGGGSAGNISSPPTNNPNDALSPLMSPTKQSRRRTHSRAGSISSVTSVGSAVGGGGGGDGKGWGLPWKWGNKNASGNLGNSVHGGNSGLGGGDDTVLEGSGGRGKKGADGGSKGSSSSRPRADSQVATDLPSSSTRTLGSSSFYSTSIKSSSASSLSREPSSTSTSPELSSPIGTGEEDSEEDGGKGKLRDMEVDVEPDDQLSSSATKPSTGRRPSQLQKSPMTALLAKWTSESSAAITTAALVHTSFSNPSSAPTPNTLDTFQSVPTPTTEFPQPTHFTAVAQSAAQWVSASGAMRGLLREGNLSPRIEEGARGLLKEVAGSVSSLGRSGGSDNGDGGKAGTGGKAGSASASLISSNASLGPTNTVTSPTKTKPKGYLSSAKGTLGRALGLGGSSKKGIATSSGLEPNVTVPTVTFSRLAPPSTASSAMASGGGTSQQGNKVLTSVRVAAPGSQATMELDTIMAPEAKPPTLAPDTGGLKNGSIDEPITDRYGFIVDVKYGVKLMRDARLKKSLAEGGGGGSVVDDAASLMSEASEDLQVPTTALPIKNQYDVEAELESLREALGLPPDPSAAGVDNGANGGKSDGTGTGNGGNKPPPEPTTQSIRRLLSQLNDMQDALEKAQIESWDAFIRKRKAKNASNAVSVERSASNPADSVIAFLGTTPTNNRDSICHDDNLIGVATMGSNGKQGREDWREFKDLVKKGIPIALRPRIWAECSGATERKEPGYYADLLSSHEGEEGLALTQIECDVTRTLPTNVYFGGDGPGVEKLRRVLAAMSWHTPLIGYCQGMNMVASTLLLTLATEEDVFWVLSCIIDRILPSDYYTSHLLVSQADQRVLRDLVEELMPPLSRHLDALDIELPAITFGWFLSLYADALPIQTLLRVFDLFLIEGSVLLFRVALALLKLNMGEIMAQDSPASLYAYMRGSMTLSCHHADRLVQVACEDFGV